MIPEAEPTPECSRIGGVDATKISLTEAPILSEAASRIGAVEAPVIPAQLESLPFAGLQAQVDEHGRVVSSNGQRSLHSLAAMLTSILNRVARDHDLKGLLIASMAGLVVAKSDGMEQEILLAALGSLGDSVIERVRRETILSGVDELTLRDRLGSRVSIRRFVGFEGHFLLVTTSSRSVPRFATDEALWRCGHLLDEFFPEAEEPKGGAPVRRAHSPWNRLIYRLLSPFRRSLFID